MSGITRRKLIQVGGGAAALGGALAITGTREATAFVEPIPWTVPDDEFRCWYIFEGDRMLLAPEIEPMRVSGMYAVPRDGGFRLCIVSIAVTPGGDLGDQAFIRFAPYGNLGEGHYHRMSPDAPRGHRILSHAPRYELPGRQGAAS